MRTVEGSGMSSKTIKWAISGLVVVGLFVVIHAAIPLLFAGVYLREVSDAESAIQTSAGQQEAVKTILEVGNLAKIPSQAKLASPKTEGSMFTRAFRMKFHADPSVVKKWLHDSKGLQNADVTHENGNTKYVIKKPGCGYGHAEVVVDASFSTVSAYVYWS